MDKKKQLRIKSEASLKQLFTDFLTSRKAFGATDKTIKTYREHFQAMSHYLNGDDPISQLQKRDIEAMIVEMRDKGLSPNSIKSYLITLRAFVNWGREELYIKGIFESEIRKLSLDPNKNVWNYTNAQIPHENEEDV